jgi:hypothetical protein
VEQLDLHRAWAYRFNGSQVVKLATERQSSESAKSENALRKKEIQKQGIDGFSQGKVVLVK